MLTNISKINKSKELKITIIKPLGEVKTKSHPIPTKFIKVNGVEIY